MLEALQFVLSSGWNLFGTTVLILAIGYSVQYVLTGVAEVIASKINK